MDDRTFVQNIMSTSTVMRHLTSRLNSQVKCYCQGDLIVEGVLRGIDFPRMWIEVDHPNHTYYLNLHKVICIESVPTDRVVVGAVKK